MLFCAEINFLQQYSYKSRLHQPRGVFTRFCVKTRVDSECPFPKGIWNGHLRPSAPLFMHIHTFLDISEGNPQ